MFVGLGSFFNVKNKNLKETKTNRKDFEKKYKTEIALMAKAQNVDMGVAKEMLMAHVKNRNIDTPYKYNFEGQENLDI